MYSRIFLLLSVSAHLYLCVMEPNSVLDIPISTIVKRERKFRYYSALDDKLCSPVYAVTTRSRMQCGIQCLWNPDCNSFFYANATGECTGCENVYNSDDASSLDEGTGTLYFRPDYALHGDECSDLRPCTDPRTLCFPGLGECACDPTRYVYSPSNNMCVEDCTQLGSTYQKYPHSYLSGYDGHSTENQNYIGPCLEKCSSSARCNGVDYDFLIRKCWFNDVAIKDHLDQWYQTTSDTYDAYVRNCL